MKFTRDVPLYGEYDVCVIGGGPAGVAAAICAARKGMNTLLVEATGALGGMATSGLVGPFMTSYDRDGDEPTVGGIFREIVDRLCEADAAVSPDLTEAKSVYTSYLKKYHRHVTPFDSFALETLLDGMVREAGVHTLCYTRFASCVTEGGRITGAVLLALEGLIAVKAKIFIDCTGIAAVACEATVPTYKGDEQTGIPQPGTLMFEVGNVCDERYTAKPESPVKAYRTPTKGVYKVNHYHVYNVDAADSGSMTRAHAEARRQVADAYAVLHGKTAGFEDALLMRVAPVLGVRESRHVRGEYTVTVEDISKGTKFDDRIAVYGFGMDIHNRVPTETGNFKIEIAKRYYIPYRSLLPMGCDNLLVAGKTLSCESQAVGGMRCMPAAMAMGQAAGNAAAIAVGQGVSPKKIDIKELQRELKAQNAILD